MSNNLASDTALEQFIELSSLLTGFDHFELVGTNQAAFYFEWVQTHAAGPFQDLMNRWSQAPAESTARQAYLESDILPSEKYSLLVRSIIKLWYLGQWYPTDNPDKTLIPSAESYQQGLVWSAIHAHPQAAKQQGFGAWSEPPMTVRVIPS